MEIYGIKADRQAPITLIATNKKILFSDNKDESIYFISHKKHINAKLGLLHTINSKIKMLESI